jgi:alkylation response protein AidB-like acyl-CoA dehydrogenase
VRDVLRREMPVSYARAMMDDTAGFTDAAWRQMASLGWLGLVVPSALGGSDLGMLELALVCEELGAVVAPVPFHSTVCLGLTAVLAAGTEAQKTEVVPAVAAGERRLTLAVAETRGTWSAGGLDAVAERTREGGYVVSGTKLFVPDARTASTIVVVARVDGGLGFFCVPASAQGLRVEPMTTVDTTRKLDAVVLDAVHVGRDGVLGDVGRDAPAAPLTLDAVVDRAKTALAAEMCGAAAAALDMSVEYAKIRKQFDRPIGSFQAIQHKLADMKVAVENARSLVYYAAWALDSGAEDAPRAAAMAKAYASDACTRVVGDAIQAHGGIGFTWEHDLHLYYKRVKAAEVTYGDATANREIVARLLAL